MLQINQNELAFIGAAMVTTFMLAIMNKRFRLSPQVALVLIPSLFGLLITSPIELGKWMKLGIEGVSNTGVMLTFAILFFTTMVEVGLFEPLVKKILQVVKGDPMKILLGTALLSLLVSLDGDGASTYIIVVAALLPLYQKVGISPLKLTTLVMLAGGVMNILPWGGPTARVMSALKLGADQVFVPLTICMAVGALWVIGVAYWFGKVERKRIGIVHLAESEMIVSNSEKPKYFWINLTLTVGLMVALIMNMVPLTVLFILGFAIAMLINFPKIEDERAKIVAFAGNALTVTSMVFAAGIFMGVGKESGMLSALGQAFTQIIPNFLGSNLSVITAMASMPFTFFMSNDGFYFGVLPTLSEAASHYGISSAEMARASLLGQPVHLLSPLVPSTYLLVGLAGVEFSDHLKHTLKWAIGTVVVMIITALLCGLIYIR
jgi:citrate-Mg2+:H+ or citrate-Ca2+:H+ symporter, CitMHS family